MSTVTTSTSGHDSDEADPQLLQRHVPTPLEYAITHVFPPIQPPIDSDYTIENDLSLMSSVCAAAHAYGMHTHGISQSRWCAILRMLDNLQASVQPGHLDRCNVTSQLLAMQSGDVLTFFVQPMNAAIILTKGKHYTLCESFEVSPSSHAIQETTESQIYPYPWSGVEIPNEVVDDVDFQRQLAHFLSQPTAGNVNPFLSSKRQYITVLLPGILQSVGRTVDVTRISKRVCSTGIRDWTRSPLWLLIRVAIQTSLDRSFLGRASYKSFLLYFKCTLARDACFASLSGDLLHLISHKIIRSLSKLGSSSPNWLSEMVLKTCVCLRETLDTRWKQLSARTSPFQNPTQGELARDTLLSPSRNRQYIRNALADSSGRERIGIPFQPNHCHHGTIGDFLSSYGTFFEKAYRVNPGGTLYDVEQSVGQEINNWIACVTDVNEACRQVEILMDKYMTKAQRWRRDTPEDMSVMLLTALQLFVALDKLVSKEIPMLAEYSPEIPTPLLEALLMCNTADLHRLSCVYQYLSARHSRSYTGWSVFSDKFTKDSFPVRYYDQSEDLQRLKARIEEGTVEMSRVYQQHLATRPLHIEVAVFESQCPACFHVWRSAIARILHFFFDHGYHDDYWKRSTGIVLVAQLPEFEPYSIDRQGPSPGVQVHLAYISPEIGSEFPHTPRLLYTIAHSEGSFSRWLLNEYHLGRDLSLYLRYNCGPLDRFVNYTFHTPNDVLAAQAHRPVGLSFDEFTAFGQLRSGGLLQWLNILQGLRSRTLNLRRQQVYYLLACTSFQVGPLDSNTGVWVWHQELQDTPFCSSLLDELDTLFMDVGTSSIDGIMMSSISLLLTRVLASSPRDNISDRAMALLQSVRRKTFNWVQELAYDLAMAPMNQERSIYLLEMAAICRSTFDVDAATLRKFLCSAEDIDTLISCSLFVRALRPKTTDNGYLRSLLQRDSRLSHALDRIFGDAILADPSNRGIDLAIARIFATYKPGTRQWERLQSPNPRWLVCETEETLGKPPKLVHLNLLDGTLRVDGQSLGGLPRKITKSAKYQQIFRDQGFFVIPSDLLGMDFMTLSVMPKYKVHFSLRDGSLMVRARCNQTNDILELIPSSKLEEDLPPVFLNGHVHWLNLATKVIEIRPLAQLWEQSSEHWRMDCTPGRCRVYKGCETLVDIESPTWAMTSACFECLNGDMGEAKSTLDILVTTSPVNADRSADPLQSSSKQRLSVVLPRYGLSFFVNNGEELESRDFKDMVYDENQCIGTLFGLENLLVLRPKRPLAGKLILDALIPRRVLVLNGSPKKHGEHQVRINTTNFTSKRPSEPLYHTYSVDTELGCLTGDGSLINTVYLARLYTITGCGIPDPLAGKTGAQAALSLLQSGGCRSIMKSMAHIYPSFWTRYPQINTALRDIHNRCYWRGSQRGVVPRPGEITGKDKEQVVARRAAYLFLSNAVRSASSLGDHDGEENMSDDIDYPTPGFDLELQNVTVSAASAVRQWCLNSPTMNTISNWVKLWDDETHDLPHDNNSVEARSRNYELELIQTLANKVPSILEETQGTCRQFQLLFLLPTTAYNSPNRQAAFRSMLVAFDAEQPLVSWDEALTTNYQGFNAKKQFTRALAQHGLSTSLLKAHHVPWQRTLEQLLSSRPAPELPSRSALSCKSNVISSGHIPVLDGLFSSLRTDTSFQREYVTQLEASAHHVHEVRMTRSAAGEDLTNVLKSHYEQCRVGYLAALALLQQSLGPAADPLEQMLHQSGHWPPTSGDVLLGCLASTSQTEMSPHWKKCLTTLALLLLDLQRARRLLRFALDGLEEEFSKELENEVCDGWDPEEYPDWLLIQVQGDFLIRRLQAMDALELMSPQSGGNTVMQVNMGEGKSSVIIPIAAAALADGRQLVRVVVPKALTTQMLEILLARLGGLVNRPIYHLPFSRTLEYDDDNEHAILRFDNLRKLMSQCMAERGILLVQPEHVAALKLMSVEQQLPQRKLEESTTALSFKSAIRDLVGNVLHSFGASESASKWLSLQKWLDLHARDVLDESDEILHPRFQLVYTIGRQKHMDGHHDRWTITQQILQLVKKHAYSLSRNAPESVEYECGPPGAFPHLRIIRGSDVGQYLISLVVGDVMTGQLPGFNFQHLSPALHDAIRSFISDEDILQVPDVAKNVEEYAKDAQQNYLWSGLLLLRGLLASNILLFALTGRRWRVDYGLVSGAQLPLETQFSSSPTTMLAIPYRAKDVPALGTEFGHPDITIILTCLSYYYAGLSEEQLKASFEMLLDQDDPPEEYALWIKEYDHTLLPDALRIFSEVNLRSSEQWDKIIFPLFSRNKAAIDFYLSRVVFPMEAKEFPWKLCASSWDLAEKRPRLITGISGTNDSRWLLPMSIAQHDLDHQQGTNAKVLACLLQPENNSYMVTHDGSDEQQRTTLGLLRIVASQHPEIRVLLDVGAQILDLSNRQVAEAWLDIVHDAAGAVYFNERDELVVLTRNGMTLPLLSSPLFQQLDRCVVYLDHVHTRGTDLKLPIGSRAAVTLGPKLTKDSLVQGCMRMRKLGHGHSVMFFAPPEVDRGIRAVSTNKDPNSRVTTLDILSWAIHETWTDIQQRAPYWAQQGMDYKSRCEAWSHFVRKKITRDRLADVWFQPERKSLMDLYAPRDAPDTSRSLSELDPSIRQRCKFLGILSLPGAQLEEEQEREVKREREREREVELPPSAQSAKHYLHPDVVQFVKTGKIPLSLISSAFRPVFAALTPNDSPRARSILATVDFCTTIQPNSIRGSTDQNLRPVQWVLTRAQTDRRDQVLVLLSPFEADCLMPDIRASEHVHLHLYAPRTSRRMKPCDDLQIYAVPSLPSDWTPPWALIDQLNVFAGQLYLRDYESYLRLCPFLGVASVATNTAPNEKRQKKAVAAARWKVRWRAFDVPESFPAQEGTLAFSDGASESLRCVMALLGARSRGRPFAQTHMGKILRGQVLTEEDF